MTGLLLLLGELQPVIGIESVKFFDTDSDGATTASDWVLFHA